MENIPPSQGDNTGKREETPPSVNTSQEQQQQPPSTEHPDLVSSTSENQKQKQPEDGDESDFDELDEVLDDFKPNSETKSTEPTKTEATPQQQQTPTNNANIDEDAFMKQLEQDMAGMMGHAAKESGTADNEGFEAAINQGADAFTKQLEESGVPPGDFLKQLLADVMAEEGGNKPVAGGGGEGQGSSAGADAGTGDGASAGEAAPESFNDAIQRTINRMKESGDKATAAAAEDDSDDLVAQLMKAVEAGAAGAGDDGDLTKMFMGMMEQLSNKEMLYEPMKELDGKFGPWIAQNKGKVSDEDMGRYETQARVVSEIVKKFEEPGYTDKDDKCREYVWQRMQEMQAAGNPPDELISNPLMEDLKGPDGTGPAMPDCPQQ